jgi:hypothetical protein
MKYTVRHVRRFMEQGKIDPELWTKRFPHVLDTRVPACHDCEDYKQKLCEGQKNPVDCFLSLKPGPDEAQETPAADDLKRKKTKPLQWSRKAQKKSMPPLADKTYDQSKM